MREQEGSDGYALAAILCARLCHDLAGTAGALSGALEMAAECGDADALALAVDCARDLAARLRLLRAAWGPVEGPMSVASLAVGLPGAERLAVSAQGAAGLTPEGQRLALSLLLAAAAALPRGGAIWLEAGPTLSVRIEGNRAAWPADLLRVLAGDAAVGHTPRACGFALARWQAGRMGLALTVEGLTLRAGQPFI